VREFGGKIRLSASDLSNHLGCRHLTELDKKAARGELQPPRWRDPALEVLQKRGFEHEREYLDHLRTLGLRVVALEGTESSSEQATVNAMRSGADVIVQIVLQSGRWYGRADVLRRVEVDTNLGPWGYEVVDTKLAKDTKAGTILQLCMYSDLVGEIQGRPPEFMHVVPPRDEFEADTFRVADYLAYYRLVRNRLEKVADSHEEGATYPDPVAQCDICRWWKTCSKRRRDDDHLSLVAGISTSQTRELQGEGIETLSELAQLPLPLTWKPQRGASESYVRVREQARVQRQGRDERQPIFELLPREPERGLARLPEPSDGDIFFDFEGARYVPNGGLEYLFGYSVFEGGFPKYHDQWALSRHDEKRVFEEFVDYVMDRWERHPGLHVYHYAPYEPSALRRLMGRYATKEDQVDRMLRSGLFVDLYAVARQSVRASVERYSIKELEQFFGFVRGGELSRASASLRLLERALELGKPESITREVREVVASYNRDDCVSALWLRDWLETLRSGIVEDGETIQRPTPAPGDVSEARSEKRLRNLAVMERLTAGVPEDREERSDEEQARWILAQLVEWHHREAKAPWWEYYRLLELSDEELLDEKAALAGMEFVERTQPTRGGPIDRYSYAKQDTTIRAGDQLHRTGEQVVGKVEAIDLVARTIDVRAAGGEDLRVSSAFAHKYVNKNVVAESLFRSAEWVANNGLDAEGGYRCARDLVLRVPPRLNTSSTGALRRPDETGLAAATRLALELDGGVLAIQGPPGSGKTFTGARMILALVEAGKKVGISAASHKVIRNLLDGVTTAAEEASTTVACWQKVSHKPSKDGPIRETKSNPDLIKALRSGKANVAGGTAWLWAREDALDAVDVLFVDEAGQMSLADVLAISQAGKSLVLLGDPQQLEQPTQGSHPEGTDASALEHILGEHQTLPPERGLFLEETWRLHPDICAFTSELFYEGRLASRPGLERQALRGTKSFDGSGLWFVPVDHEGNQSSSREETDKVVGLVSDLLQSDAVWIDRQGDEHPLRLNDIVIVAPYNAQVANIGEAIPGARVGTVDKFQGQEAPVVIYSMTTSSPEEAPRGMEFLYSLNRLNVATSRALCTCILVASPRLLSAECRTPRQIRLANALCRYYERASE